MTPIQLARDNSLAEVLRQDRLEHRARRLGRLLVRLRDHAGLEHVVANFERELDQVRADLGAPPAPATRPSDLEAQECEKAVA